MAPFDINQFLATFKSGVPPYVGYGGLVPTGVGGALNPFSGQPNSMGGYSTFLGGTRSEGPAGGSTGVKPWQAPGVGNSGYQPSGMINTGGGAGMGSFVNGGTVGSGGAGPVGGGGNGWLQNIVSQAGGLNSQLPPMPDFGIRDTAQNNQLQYNHFLQNQANANNDNLSNLSLQAAQGQGQSAKADVSQLAAQQNAHNSQDLVSRGLTNSTIGPTLAAGVTRESNRQNQNIDEGTARMLIGILQNRQYEGPNGGMLAELLRAAANQASPALWPGGGVSYGGNFGANLSGGLGRGA